MSNRTIKNNWLNQTKHTEKDERIIKKCKCGNSESPYLLIINPKTQKIEEVMELRTGKTARVNKSKSKSKSAPRLKRGGGKKKTNKNKKTNKKKTNKKKTKGKRKHKKRGNKTKKRG